MSRLSLGFAGILGVALSGCAYHGAVYSEYSQFALDVRSTAESSAPIKVDLGYDRGVCAFVPKLHGKDGEACSIISWQNIGSSPDPIGLGSNELLTVDAAVISGTAADVAALPASMNVSIAQPAGRNLAVTTTGNAGSRIAAALSPLTFGQDVNTARIKAWIKKDPSNNRAQLRKWMDDNNLKDVGITNLLDADQYASSRQAVVHDLKIKESP